MKKTQHPIFISSERDYYAPESSFETAKVLVLLSNLVLVAGTIIYFL